MLRRLLCLIFWHDDHPMIAPARVYLQCARCQRQTSGWTGLVAGEISDRQRHARFWQWVEEREKDKAAKTPKIRRIA